MLLVAALLQTCSSLEVVALAARIIAVVVGVGASCISWLLTYLLGSIMLSLEQAVALSVASGPWATTEATVL